VILADEPTGNLDRRTGEGVEDVLMEMNRELQATLLAVTHNPRLAGKMDRQLELVDGRIMQCFARTEGEEEGK
jgi:predicted ABC-type transport system involved in lysophospholipase L1 biosynthesis ATPase subunit